MRQADTTRMPVDGTDSEVLATPQESCAAMRICC
jgi:hypothetical protein